MSAYGIFKVIYAPREAFKEIAQNPRYLGPILVMILFIVANVGAVYTLFTKTYIEVTVPSPENKDLWTENKAFWEALNGADCAENSTDYIAGKYYGNRSIEFSVKSNRIAMELREIGGVNCSPQGGYTTLYLRVKWTAPEYPPENASLWIYSGTASSYQNITNKLSHPRVWNNLTISLADKSWVGEIDWGNVTGLKLEIMWNQASDVRVLLDGLFFGGVYKSYAEEATTYLAFYAANSFMQFTLRWFLFGGIIFVLTRLFKAKTVWRVILVLVGSILITMFVQAVASAATFSALPTLKYPLEYVGGVKGEAESAYSKILEETWFVNRVYSVLQMVIIIWTVVLCGIAIRQTMEFTWTTSLLTAFTAYFATMFLETLLLQI
ncbi:MAG: hypothetical protein QW510_04305 [Candidatus Bathyarchaeia archaeon]